MSAIPYMPLYIADYLADAAHLTTVEHGAYLLLIMNYWQRGKPLDNSNGRLTNVARTSNEEWAKIEPVVAEFFEVDGDVWTHKRIEQELARFRAKSDKARGAGKASAQRRFNGRPTDVQRTLNHTDTDTDTDLELNLLPLEQEAARECESEARSKKFDLGGVGLGLGQGEISPKTRLAVAKALNVADPTPIVDAYRRWSGSRKAKSIDAHFRASAKRIFGNLNDDERAACQPLDPPTPEIVLKPVTASPQLVALLNRSRSYAN